MRLSRTKNTNNSSRIMISLLLIVLASFLITSVEAQVDCVTCGGTQPDPMFKVEDYLACIDVKKSISEDACKNLKDKYEDKCCNAEPKGGAAPKKKPATTTKKTSGGGGGGGGNETELDWNFYLQLGGVCGIIITMFMVCYSTFITRRTRRTSLWIEEKLELMEKDILELAECGIPMSIPKHIGGGGRRNSPSGAPIIINNSNPTDQIDTAADKEAQEEHRIQESLRERLIGDMSNLYYQMKNNTLEVVIRNYKFLKFNIDIEDCYVEEDRRVWQNYNETYDDFFSKFLLYGSQLSTNFNPDMKSKMDELLGGFVKVNKILQATYYNKDKGGIKITQKTHGGLYDDDDEGVYDSDDDSNNNNMDDSGSRGRSSRSKSRSKKSKKEKVIRFKEDTSKFDKIINSLINEIMEFDQEMADHIQIEKMKYEKAKLFKQQQAKDSAARNSRMLKKQASNGKGMSRSASVGRSLVTQETELMTVGDGFDDEYDDYTNARQREDRSILMRHSSSNFSRADTRESGHGHRHSAMGRQRRSSSAAVAGGNRGRRNTYGGRSLDANNRNSSRRGGRRSSGGGGFGGGFRSLLGTYNEDDASHVDTYADDTRF